MTVGFTKNIRNSILVLPKRGAIVSWNYLIITISANLPSSSWSNMQFPCKFYSLFKEMITEDYYWLAEDSFVQSMIIKEEYT